MPILKHLAHPLLGHFSFFSLTKIKFDIFHMLLAKNEAVQGHCIGWGKPTLDANQETIYIYIFIYIYLYSYIYIYICVCIILFCNNGNGYFSGCQTSKG